MQPPVDAKQNVGKFRSQNARANPLGERIRKIGVGAVVLGFVLGLSGNGIAYARPAATAENAQGKKLRPKPTEQQIERDVQRNLVEIPWYGVFDNLEYEVKGSTVIVSG